MALHVDSKAKDFDTLDLYLLLNLDAEGVRKKLSPEQDRVIDKAARQIIPLLDSDCCPDDLAVLIRNAYSILKQREERALYHDLRDRRRGFPTNLKPVFFPEACGSEERIIRSGLFVCN
jgi:hypothetical protein